MWKHLLQTSNLQKVACLFQTYSLQDACFSRRLIEISKSHCMRKYMLLVQLGAPAWPSLQNTVLRFLIFCILQIIIMCFKPNGEHQTIFQGFYLVPMLVSQVDLSLLFCSVSAAVETFHHQFKCVPFLADAKTIPSSARQGSLLFPKIEFFIKAEMRGWSFL